MPLVWTGSRPLVLASTSATRRHLLEHAGIVVLCDAPGIDERAVEREHRGLGPRDLARMLAEAKALAVSARRPGHIVVGADQVLQCEGELLHKPIDLADAAGQIAKLSGRRHHLHAAVAIAEDGRITDGFVEDANLTMRDLDAAAIARYVEAAGFDRVTASVGGYQLEGLGIHLFSRIEGDHSTILGLPLLPLLDRLRRRGCLVF